MWMSEGSTLLLVPYGLYFGQEVPNWFQLNRNLDLEQMHPTTWEYRLQAKSQNRPITVYTFQVWTLGAG